MTNNENFSDIFNDLVPFNIHEVKSGTLYNFTEYTQWNEENLFIALKMVLEGKTGLLKYQWPFATGKLFLKYI